MSGVLKFIMGFYRKRYNNKFKDDTGFVYKNKAIKDYNCIAHGQGFFSRM